MPPRWSSGVVAVPIADSLLVLTTVVAYRSGDPV
jgi:hypothetical protein